MKTKLRQVKSEDIPLILSSWMKAYLKSPQNRFILKDIYFSEHRRALEKLDVDIIVSCNPEHEDQIFGYLAKKNKNILHFIYVKQAFRQFGIASNLIKESGIETPVFCSHYTESGDSLLKKLEIQSIFNPYLLCN